MKNRFIFFLLLTAGYTFVQSKEYSSFDDLKKDMPSKKVTGAIISFDLTGIDLSGWTFKDAIFNNGSKGNAVFKGTTIEASKDKQSFFNSEMSSTNFENATVKNTTFKGKVGDKSKFNGATLKDIVFEQDVEASFEKAKQEDTTFKGNITGISSFKEATIKKTTFEKDAKANFDKATLSEVKFLGSLEGSSFDGATATNCTDKEGKLLTIKDGKLKAS